MSFVISLDTVPQEVLEHIALYSATHNLLGPPSGLVPLLRTCRHFHACLSITYNHHLYARIFTEKFDFSAAKTRFGQEQLGPYALAQELRRRCVFLKRIRDRLDSKLVDPTLGSNDDADNDILRDVLFHAYLMMLENEGKNELQLREYAKMDAWLREFWFDEQGASGAISSINTDSWPPNNRKTALAMWLFWFLLKPDDYPNSKPHTWTVLNVLRIFGLAAHKYNLTSPSWVDFVPRSLPESKPVDYYSDSYRLRPPPLATPAILSFLKLVNRPDRPVPLTPWEASQNPGRVQDWQCEWERCLSLGRGDFGRELTRSFAPGSLEGVWEGLFTYTEFTAYAAILAGAPPIILQKSMVVRHQQTWKLHEHHLLSSDLSHSDSGIDMDLDNGKPLPSGDPLRSYFPAGTLIKDLRTGIEVREPGKKEVFRYQKYQKSSVIGERSRDDEKKSAIVRDIIITGEGHSAWGQFNLVGRVRPCDGFISLSKEYVDGDRGRWLYRGYLVGDANGNLAGRWRDTLSAAEVQGYEGCFAMGRRR